MNEDDCIENLMKKFNSKLPKNIKPKYDIEQDIYQQDLDKTTDQDNNEYDKMRSAYVDLTRRHNELIDYITKMSKEQISDTYLDCIKNDNVLLYQVNQDLRIIVKELCIKINDLKNESKKIKKTAIVTKESNNFEQDQLQNSRIVQENTKIIEMKNLEIKHLTEQFEKVKNSHQELENKSQDVSNLLRFKKDLSTEVERLNKNLSQANRMIDDFQTINKNLESLNQQKANEIAGFVSKVNSFQSQINEKDKKHTSEIETLKSEINQLRFERDNFKNNLQNAISIAKSQENNQIEKQTFFNELHQIKRSNEELSKKLSDALKYVDSLKSFNSDLGFEKTNLINKNQILETKLKDLEQKYQYQEFSFANKIPSNSQSHSHLEMENMRINNKHLNIALKSNDDVIKSLNSKVNELQNQLDQMKRNAERGVTVSRSYSQRPIIRDNDRGLSTSRTNQTYENPESSRPKLTRLLSQDHLDVQERPQKVYVFPQNDVSRKIVEHSPYSNNQGVNYSIDNQQEYINLSQKGQRSSPVFIPATDNDLNLASENSKLLTKIQFLQNSNQQYMNEIDNLKKEMQRKIEDQDRSSKFRNVDVYSNEKVIEFNNTLTKMINQQENSVSPINNSMDYLNKELENARLENQRLRHQIQEIMGINQNNVTEIRRLTNQINELHEQMFQIKIGKNG